MTTPTEVQELIALDISPSARRLFRKATQVDSWTHVILEPLEINAHHHPSNIRRDATTGDVLGLFETVELEV
ncbi:hypothetical protein LP421_08455 [Rhizobium sp. RCAM05350]|nr:hypothetical protein LP421_08455 [Rhizobium sp. RCAM05350]